MQPSRWDPILSYRFSNCQLSNPSDSSLNSPPGCGEWAWCGPEIRVRFGMLLVRPGRRHTAGPGFNRCCF